MDLLLAAVEALVPMSLLAIFIVLIAVQFLPTDNTEAEESDSNILL
ncbi:MULTISPECIES: hypothetical protein [unclassified Mucilaginibacter]|nr:MULTISPECIES: hypothetical protein [unclassified Mucilaginibacter]MEB0260184.1 hypothetical protein [Mucilaginibacter sp. 10I4]MEB0277405.1 hypothetical protein [Mucilaginibacter sp. 10B2]MEB0300113.1 hypothetical protein [Mucilaginibacter sp. 5C4]WPX25529.1 hypothetical protein RHM67_09650 [Mucilaginibacter sp. 5C4]